MTQKHLTAQKGFTLVELSIVLVIIGLIISSVLVGQDLVRAAELRSTVTQYEQFNAAAATFRGKYNGLPGDVTGTAFGFTGAGDGNGLLAVSGVTGHAAGENVHFWSHLGSTGAALISGSYDGTQIIATAADTTLGLPKAKAGESWSVFERSGVNYFILGATTPGTASYQTTAAVLTGLDARALDEKMDDGRPGRGIVQARGAAASNANSGTTTGCVSAVNAGADADINDPILPTAASTYVTTGSTVACTLRIRFNL